MGICPHRAVPVQPNGVAPLRQGVQLLRVPYGVRDPPIEWLVLEYRAHRAFLVRRFRAVVRLIIHHLAQRRRWSNYGRRLQLEPGLHLVFNQVERRKGVLRNKKQ
jgi:hypothetical protein